MSFSSIGATNHTSSDPEFHDSVNLYEMEEYIWGADSCAGIGNVLFKLKSDNTILAVNKDEHYSNSVIDDLKRGIYDEYTMNQFSLYRPELEDPEQFDPFEIMENTPEGYLEYPEEDHGKPKKMFGWDCKEVTIRQQTYPGSSICRYYKMYYCTKYVFWINVKEKWGDEVPNSEYYDTCPGG